MVFDCGLADELRTCAARHVERGVPGLTMLVARDGAVFVEAVGSLGDRRGPTTRDAQYRIASTTKIVTALATLALVEDGRLGLDDPVETFLPELGAPRVLAAPDGPLDDTRPARRSITVRDLLTFTNGFGMYIDMFAAPTPWPIVLEEQRLGLVTLGPPNPTVQPPPDEWIARLGKLPLLAEPGTRFLYNTGASILGVLIGRASGTSFGAYLRGRILDPLAMTETDFYASDPQRLATAYRPTPAGLERLRARRGLHAPAGLRGRRVRTRRHGGRPLRPRPAPARRGSRPRLGRRDPFDDERPAARRAEGRRRLRTRLLRRALLGLRPRREPRRLLRVGRWAGHLVPRRSTTPARGHRAHSTTLRVARDTGRAP